MPNMEENESTEFKKSTSELKEALISIVAILNKHQRGKIIFGISSKGEFIGQTISEKTLRDISKAISDYIEPKIYPFVKKEIIQEKECAIIDFSGNETPYFYDGKPYLRVADENKRIIDVCNDAKVKVTFNMLKSGFSVVFYKPAGTTQKIIDLIKINPQITRKELSKEIGMSEDGIKYNLNKLVREGKLKRIGPDKGGHWEVN